MSLRTISVLILTLIALTGCTREQFRDGLIQVGIALSPSLVGWNNGVAADAVGILDDVRAKCVQIEAVAAGVDAIVAGFQPNCRIRTPIAKARAGISSICTGQAPVTQSNLSRIHLAVTDAYRRVKLAEADGC
jgi:hypothetical protein